MGIDIQKNISKVDIDRVQLLRNPPPYDAGDDLSKDLGVWVDRNQELNNRMVGMRVASMKRCPACGSKLYFEDIQGLKGIEDRCFDCDFNRRHIEVYVIPKRTLKVAAKELLGLYKQFSKRR